MPGDLILIYNRKSVSKAMQQAIRWKRTRVSHIAIVSSMDTVIHATPRNGVHYKSLKSVISEATTNGFRVIRHCDLDNDNDMELTLYLVKRLRFYHEQSYNFLFFWRRRETASYCSELAAKAYKDIKHSLSARQPRNTLPVDIERNLSDKNWLDVTGLYLEDRFFLNGELEAAAENSQKINSYIHHMARTQKKIVEAINERNRKLGLPPMTPFTSPVKFWDTKPNDD